MLGPGRYFTVFSAWSGRHPAHAQSPWMSSTQLSPPSPLPSPPPASAPFFVISDVLTISVISISILATAAALCAAPHLPHPTPPSRQTACRSHSRWGVGARVCVGAATGGCDCTAGKRAPRIVLKRGEGRCAATTVGHDALLIRLCANAFALSMSLQQGGLCPPSLRA